MQVVVQRAAQGLRPYISPDAPERQQDPGADQDTFFDKPVRVLSTPLFDHNLHTPMFQNVICVPPVRHPQ